MECYNVREKLSEFIDNELDADQTNAIKAHLIRCPECKRARDKMEQMGQLIRHMPPVNTPSDFQFRVYSAIRRKELNHQKRWFSGWRAVLVPVTAMFIGIFIGLSSDALLSGNAPVPILTADEAASGPDHGLAPEELFAALMANGGAGRSLVVDSEDSEIVRDYNLDRYVYDPLVPVTVDTIPDNNRTGTNRSTSGRSHGVYSSRQYVLDDVPMRVGYERTVY